MFRRFLLLWALLPALCLGLLGQGRGLVLCQEACGCVAVETAHARHAHGHDHADCGHDHADHAGCACGHDEETDAGCRDTALDAGDHVVPAAVKLPDLTMFPVALLAWHPLAAWESASSGLDCALARGPPPQREPSLPQVLACVRSTVRVI